MAIIQLVKTWLGDRRVTGSSPDTVHNMESGLVVLDTAPSLHCVYTCNDGLNSFQVFCMHSVYGVKGEC